jgi:hypothetical protein
MSPVTTRRGPEEGKVAGSSTGKYELQRQESGAGPLHQRDYWAVIRDPAVDPTELVEALCDRFPALAPEELVQFAPALERPLEVGDEMAVRIKGAGEFRVRVIHRDRQSLTLATLAGHPEAGRITFGAYRNRGGDLVFHIRSRARASSRIRLIGFHLAGDPMQTNTWTDFINRVAATFGGGVAGRVHVEKRSVRPEPGDHAADRPTFQARGG